jgi:1-deoxy-D-xylulose-5-phosphate reductoisomerase
VPARDIVILGSTGSVGGQAVDLVRSHPDWFRVVGLAAGGSQIERLAEQVAQTGATTVAVPDAAAADRLTAQLGRLGLSDRRVWAGPAAMVELAGSPCHCVLNALPGFAGLEPTLATLAAGTRLALANKESLVAGGPLVRRAARPGQIAPVDSEHSALAQALRGGRAEEVRRLVLTASGGPFRGRSRVQLAQVTAAQALAHPTWRMGRVITVNSATMVNKGLELIEAARLFDVALDRIEVVVHPQSIVHSMVEFYDGSTLAQCSPPDMRLPIALGLSWPDRLPQAIAPLDWSGAQSWTFEPLDAVTFPAVDLARRVGQISGTAPAVFNGANEVLVDAFCEGRIGFLDIVDRLTAVVDRHLGGTAPAAGPGAVFVADADLALEAVQRADAWARAAAEDFIDGKGATV